MSIGNQCFVSEDRKKCCCSAIQAPYTTLIAIIMKLFFIKYWLHMPLSISYQIIIIDDESKCKHCSMARSLTYIEGVGTLNNFYFFFAQIVIYLLSANRRTLYKLAVISTEFQIFNCERERERLFDLRVVIIQNQNFSSFFLRYYVRNDHFSCNTTIIFQFHFTCFHGLCSHLIWKEMFLLFSFMKFQRCIHAWTDLFLSTKKKYQSKCFFCRFC